MFYMLRACVFKLTCVETFRESKARTPVSLLVKTIKIHNRVEGYRTPTSSKSSWIEMVTTGFVSVGTRRKTKDKRSTVDQLKKTCFIKLKVETCRWPAASWGEKNKKNKAPAVSDSQVNLRKCPPQFVISQWLKEGEKIPVMQKPRQE